MEFIDGFIHKRFIEQELRFSKVYSDIGKYITTDKFTDIENVNRDCGVKNNHTIWIMWMQGIENAPALIKKCYQSICRNKPKDFDIVLLTEENIFNYIKLPEYILEKYASGKITITHLSDIIRVELLSVYGGCWIDATVFCAKPIPTYMLSDMFFFKLESILCDPVIKMSSWWMAADKDNRLIHAVRNVLRAYWKKENNLIDYFLLHIIMSKIIDEDTFCRDIYNNIPFFNSKNAQILVEKLDQPYNERDWKIMTDGSFVQKLTYKNYHIRGDIYSFYEALLDNVID